MTITELIEKWRSIAEYNDKMGTVPTLIAAETQRAFVADLEALQPPPASAREPQIDDPPSALVQAYANRDDDQPDYKRLWEEAVAVNKANAVLPPPAALAPGETPATFIFRHGLRGAREIEHRKPCLYTQVRSCLEEYPDQPDHWCGECTRQHEAREET